MLVTEEELAVEVAQVDCIQINDSDLSNASRAEARQDEVLQKFTSDATGADHKNFRLHIPG